MIFEGTYAFIDVICDCIFVIRQSSLLQAHFRRSSFPPGEALATPRPTLPSC